MTADELLARALDGSVQGRLVTRTRDRLAHAWPGSAGGRALAAWREVRLERRVRLAAIVVFTAIVTHLILTKFDAPEPTWWARAAWIALLAATAAAGVAARGIAAAWRDRTLRRVSRHG